MRSANDDVCRPEHPQFRDRHPRASSISAAVRRVLKKQGFVPDTFITDKLPSYGAALKDLGLAKHHDFGGRKTNMQLSQCRLTLTDSFYPAFPK